MWDLKYMEDSMTAAVSKQVLGPSWALGYREDLSTALPGVAHIPTGQTDMQLIVGWA